MEREMCPFCKNEVRLGADVCGACGAQKGYGKAGQSKHAGGLITLVFGVLAFFSFSTGEPLLALMGFLFGAVTLGFGLSWLINLSTPPKWYRPNIQTYR